MVKTGRQFLRKTRWVEDPVTGNFKKHVEEIWDQAVIDDFKRREKREARRTRKMLTVEEEEEERERKKEVHRLQEQERRARERIKKTQALRAKLEEGIGDDHTAKTIRGKQPRCSACGMYGHNSRSPDCVLYEQTRQKERVAHEQGLVRQVDASGMRLKIAATKEQEIKVKLDLRKTSQWKRKKMEEEFRDQVKKRPNQTGSRADRAQRKAGSAEVKLNNELEDIVKPLKDDPKFHGFSMPASKWVPDYTKVIKHPMDLHSMREKCRAMLYGSVRDFKADLQLIVSNCHEFNTKRGRNLDLEPVAKQLQEAALSELHNKEEVLKAIEARLANANMPEAQTQSRQARRDAKRARKEARRCGAGGEQAQSAADAQVGAAAAAAANATATGAAAAGAAAAGAAEAGAAAACAAATSQPTSRPPLGATPPPVVESESACTSISATTSASAASSSAMDSSAGALEGETSDFDAESEMDAEIESALSSSEQMNFRSLSASHLPSTSSPHAGESAAGSPASERRSAMASSCSMRSASACSNTSRGSEGSFSGDPDGESASEFGDDTETTDADGSVAPTSPGGSSVASFDAIDESNETTGWSDVSDSEMADEGEEQPATSDVDANDANDDDDDDDLFEEQLAAGMES